MRKLPSPWPYCKARSAARRAKTIISKKQNEKISCFSLQNEKSTVTPPAAHSRSQFQPWLECLPVG
jgi:hypothetical protein